VAESQQTVREIGVSNLFLYFVILLIILALSFWFLYGGSTYYVQGNLEYAAIMLIVGFIGLGFSVMVVRRLRKRMALLQPPVQNVFTVEQCGKCGFKNIKRFQLGDYVFKTAEKCPKCGELTTISSIYLESPPVKK
jgi:hypothetical protein